MTDPDQPDSAWIRRFHSSPEARRRVVCFPHAGGSASFWYSLSEALQPGVEVLAVQYPGRETRLWEDPERELAALADGAFEALLPWLGERPALLGHSMGAVVAFEVARRMEDKLSVTPSVLVASACRAPSGFPRENQIHRLDDDGLLAALAGLGAMDDRLRANREILSLILPAIRADLQAVETYRAADGAAVACPVVALVGDRDPEVSAEQARGWRAHTAAGFECRIVAGGHFYLSENPGTLALSIQDILANFA